MKVKPKKKSKMSQSKEVLNEIKHLTILMEYSAKNIDGKSEELDSLFTNQVNKLQEKIDKLKGNQ